MELRIEGQEEPVFKEFLAFDGSPAQMVDKAFQKFLFWGHFLDTVKDLGHRLVLSQAQGERCYEMPWYLRTYRFLRARDFSDENMHFIFTADKSDLSEKYRKLAEAALTPAPDEEEAVISDDSTKV